MRYWFNVILIGDDNKYHHARDKMWQFSFLQYQLRPRKESPSAKGGCSYRLGIVTGSALAISSNRDVKSKLAIYWPPAGADMVSSQILTLLISWAIIIDGANKIPIFLSKVIIEYSNSLS